MNKLIAGLVVIAALLIFGGIFFCEFPKVEGNEIGVLETWSGGVDETPYPAKTYFFFFKPLQKMYTYPLDLQIFVMNDTPEAAGESGEGREYDAYLVQSREGQDMHISLNVQWKIDPNKVVQIHKEVRTNIPDKLIRPVVMRIVKDEATKIEAVQAYSGEGLVNLQNDIYLKLTSEEGELKKRGIIVENFVIERIRLNEKYIGEITERQIATQTIKKEQELASAADQMAKRVESEAKAEYNQRVVKAEGDKRVGILNAEKEAESQVVAANAKAEQTVIQAKAQAEQVSLAAKADKDARFMEAEANLEIGKSKAEAIRLEMQAYNTSGAENYVTMETAKSMAQAFKGINGYLPSDMKINVLTTSFTESLRTMLKSVPANNVVANN